MIVADNYIYSLKPNFEKTNLILNNKGYNLDFKLKLGDYNDELLDKYPMYSRNRLYHMAYKKIFDEMEWKYGRTKRN